MNGWRKKGGAGVLAKEEKLSGPQAMIAHILKNIKINFYTQKYITRVDYYYLIFLI